MDTAKNNAQWKQCADQLNFSNTVKDRPKISREDHVHWWKGMHTRFQRSNKTLKQKSCAGAKESLLTDREQWIYDKCICLKPHCRRNRPKSAMRRPPPPPSRNSVSRQSTMQPQDRLLIQAYTVNTLQRNVVSSFKLCV